MQAWLCWGSEAGIRRTKHVLDHTGEECEPNLPTAALCHPCSLLLDISGLNLTSRPSGQAKES